MAGYPAGFYSAPYGPLTSFGFLSYTFRRETKKNSGCRAATIGTQTEFLALGGEKIWPRDASQCSHSACFMPTLHLARSPQTPRKSISAFFRSLNGFLWHLRASRELQCRHKTRAVRATQCISGPDFFGGAGPSRWISWGSGGFSRTDISPKVFDKIL